MAACADVGAPLQVLQELETKEEIIALAAAGMGVGLVPESSRTRALSGVRFIAVRGKLPAVEVSIVTGPRPSPWAERYVQALRAHAK